MGPLWAHGTSTARGVTRSLQQQRSAKQPSRTTKTASGHTGSRSCPARGGHDGLHGRCSGPTCAHHAQASPRRVRKRALGNPNAIRGVLQYAEKVATSPAALSPMERAEDLFFVIAMVERGVLQLMEPQPGDIQLSALQRGTQQLQHVVHVLINARDLSLRGNLQWHRADFWQNIMNLVTPPSVLIDRGGTPAARTRPTTWCTQLTALDFQNGGEEAPARTRCVSSAALLLCDAADDIRRIIPTLTGTNCRSLQVLCKLWSNGANPSSGDCQLPARRQKTALRTRRLGGGELARQPTRRTSRSTTRIRKDSSRSTASELNLYQDCMEPIADKPLEARGAKGGTSLGLAPGLGYVGQPQAKPKQPWAACRGGAGNTATKAATCDTR